METSTAFKNIKIGELCLIYDAKLLKVFLSDRRTVFGFKKKNCCMYCFGGDRNLFDCFNKR